jgi:hypothetical protein
MIPRKDRPMPDELDGYEREFDDDPDYSQYRRERANFIYDWQRREEIKRIEDEKRTPLEGHDLGPPPRGSQTGFDKDGFSLASVVKTIETRPKH